MPTSPAVEQLDERKIWSPNGQSLYLTHQAGTERRSYAVDVPPDRRGRIEVTPRLVGSLPEAVTLDAVDAQEGWALITEQHTFDTAVVHLPTGRVFPMHGLGLLEFLHRKRARDPPRLNCIVLRLALDAHGAGQGGTARPSVPPGGVVLGS